MACQKRDFRKLIYKQKRRIILCTTINNKNFPKIALGTWSLGTGATGGDQVLDKGIFSKTYPHENVILSIKFTPQIAGKVGEIGVFNYNLA